MCLYNIFPRHLINSATFEEKKVIEYKIYIFIFSITFVIDKLIEIGRCYGMEINVEKNKSNENFKTTVASKNYDRPKTTGEFGILNIWVAF